MWLLFRFFFFNFHLETNVQLLGLFSYAHCTFTSCGKSATGKSKGIAFRVQIMKVPILKRFHWTLLLHIGLKILMLMILKTFAKYKQRDWKPKLLAIKNYVSHIRVGKPFDYLTVRKIVKIKVLPLLVLS